MKRNLLIAGLSALALIAPAFGQAPTRFSVTVTGKGPDVILVPGLASSAAVWDETTRQLSPTHRVHVVQVAGFAGAAPGDNAGEGALKAITQELTAYAARLDHPAIIGHSLGGLLALQVAEARPDAVSRVLVVDALPFYPLIVNPAATVEMVAGEADAMLEQLVLQSDAQYAAGAQRTAARLVKSESGRALVAKWAATSDKSAAARLMHDDIITDARPGLPLITAKLTVVYAFDAVMGAQAEVDRLYKSAYAGRPATTLKRVDGSYHFIMLDQPAAFAKEVDAFLR